MFYIINKIPVFLSHKKYNALFKIIMADKDVLYKMKSTINGTKESTEKRRVINNHLLFLYNNDKDNFNNNWFEFELLGEEAKDNSWDILNDYCSYYGHSSLSDIRFFQKKVIDNYSEDYIRYPMGKIFSLNHNVKPQRWWWKYTQHMTNRNIFVIIDARSVNKIIGNLKHFRLYTDNFIVDCGKEFGIYPITDEE